jgi:uncharacterized membrane-anchored protein YitT (DUF2179 family)
LYLVNNFACFPVFKIIFLALFYTGQTAGVAMNRKQILLVVFEYLMITVGAFIMSIGIGVFLIDAHVVPGGVSGLSMTLYYYTEGAIPVGLSMWIFNIPLFIWGIKEIGNSFGWRTFYGFTANAFFTDLVRGEFPLFPSFALQKTEAIRYLLHQDFFFLILWGGALLGIGLGIVFKFKGTTAGTDIIAAIFNKKFGIKPGQAIIFADLVVILSAAAILAGKNIPTDQPVATLTMYAFFLLLISSRLVDLVIDGFDYARAVHIISDKQEEIGKAIMNKLSRGATVIRAKGLYRNVERNMLYTVVAPREVTFLYDIIQEIDPGAFVIVGNVHEVMGEGFKRRSELSLQKKLIAK